MIFDKNKLYRNVLRLDIYPPKGGNGRNRPEVVCSREDPPADFGGSQVSAEHK